MRSEGALAPLIRRGEKDEPQTVELLLAATLSPAFAQLLPRSASAVRAINGHA
jgi:hypothetical protein